MQTKKQSFIESFTNTAIGFIISWASTFIIFPFVGFESNPAKNLLITLYFTVISIARSYILRRFFNRKVVGKVPQMQNLPPTPAKNNYIDPTICACGHQHPLVAEFGICGGCADKLGWYP